MDKQNDKKPVEKKQQTPLYEKKQDYKILKMGIFYRCSLDGYKRIFDSEELARDFFDKNREHYL